MPSNARLVLIHRTTLVHLLLSLLPLLAIGCGKSGTNQDNQSGRTDDAPGKRDNVSTVEPSKADLEPKGSFSAAEIKLGGAAHSGETLFASLSAAECGIEFMPKWKPRNKAEALLLKTGFTGGGVCFGDYDGDGLADLFLTRPHGGGRLYRNLGDFQFADVTKAADVVRSDDWQTGAAFCDLNNDGKLDLIVACLNSPNRLFLNQGDGTFEDVAAASGFDFAGATIKTLFADYDNDGDLDIYVVTNRLEPDTPTKIRYTGSKGAYDVAPEHQELAMVINLPSGEQKFAKAGQFDRLYRNDLNEDGRLAFTNVTRQAGLTGNYHGLDGCWWDADDDGDADLYVTNDFTDPDQFYRNNGDGTFTDITKQSLPCTPWFAMGCDVGDLNNDGKLDLLAADMAGTTHYREKMAMGSMDAVAWFLDAAEPRQYMRNALYVNTGTERFQEAAHLAGLASSDWTWSVKIADFDNDGREDAFFTNGFTRDYLNSDFNNKLQQSSTGSKSLAWYDAPRLDEQNHAFHNRGDLEFVDVSKSWGLDHLGISFGAATADLDNDGDLDIIVNNFEAAPSIYRNGSADQHCCKIKLVGTEGNRQAIGASIRIETELGSQFRYCNPSGGYLSSDEPIVHFGLGIAKSIQQLVVRWPSGRVQTLKQVPANQLLTIVEPNGDNKRNVEGKGEGDSGVAADDYTQQNKATENQATENHSPSNRDRMFAETNLLADVIHREQPFDDFQQQPLLPCKLSQLGPGVATGDVNGDRLADVFVGGATGEPGRLLVQNADHTFRSMQLECLALHRDSEDMGCLLIDTDGDGDLDLYVVSGGVEHELNSTAYRDRLYVNVSTKDKVAFVHSSDAVPDNRDSGSSVSAVDFDQDGDLDLFVGGRVVPGRYPTSPKSRLLRNDDGVFNNATSAVIDAGMVTGSLWSDFDNDGWIDLLVTNDYGPIRLFRNDHGTLVDASDAAGTATLLGWWNSITGCDVDADGDTDYIVGNLGRNTKYHPNEKKPQYLFYGRFRDGEPNRIVEAKSSKEGLLPTRGRSCSCNAMPFLADKFETFHGFASASLNDIYSESLLQEAKRVVATVVESGVLVNTLQPDGSRVLKFRPLPVDAQMAPVFGIEAIDANNDGVVDLFLAQNFYTPQRETGRMAGGLSCVLLGNGDGTFKSVSAAVSGIVIPQDAKSTVATDLDGDGQLDLIVTTNNGPVRTFELNRFASHDQMESEPTKNDQAKNDRTVDWPIGSSRILNLGDGRKTKVERYAGSGYLSGN